MSAGAIVLGWGDLALAALLVVVLVALLALLRLGMARPVAFAAARMAAQLAAVGFILEWIFDLQAAAGVACLGALMVAIAGREVAARQRGAMRFGQAWLLGSSAMALSSALVATMLLTIIQPLPWWDPQYAIPLLGMLLGNTMNGIALGLERAASGVRRSRTAIEARLLQGASIKEALGPLRREAIGAALIPTVNGMAIAGLVSLPGMMTGQILAGAPPLEAVRYQILIWLGIAAGTGFGAVCAVQLLMRRLSDERERLRLDRLE
ncbi:MAG: iron export ABC transporter permease subunit FetB [Planctomycetota bacterium]|jgi:putative ABC transport system permease protein|nr:iron export ABC transporter permease subunit FetB [Planctomycetota bacterium]